MVRAQVYIKELCCRIYFGYPNGSDLQNYKLILTPMLVTRPWSRVPFASLIVGEPDFVRVQSDRIQRRNSSLAEPPPPGGHLPSIATSQLLRTTRERALRTPGLVWNDDATAGRECRKMNVYQAVRDALRSVCYVEYYWILTSCVA
jgi:hypothetical protein